MDLATRKIYYRIRMIWQMLGVVAEHGDGIRRCRTAAMVHGESRVDGRDVVDSYTSRSGAAVRRYRCSNCSPATAGGLTRALADTHNPTTTMGDRCGHAINHA